MPCPAPMPSRVINVVSPEAWANTVTLISAVWWRTPQAVVLAIADSGAPWCTILVSMVSRLQQSNPKMRWVRLLDALPALDIGQVPAAQRAGPDVRLLQFLGEGVELSLGEHVISILIEG